MSNSNKSYEICPTCVMDNESGIELEINHNGECKYCRGYKEDASLLLKEGDEGKTFLEQQIAKIKADGKGKDYDCIIGLSGGVDSSYVALLMKDYGLRPLVVHLDNGWNSELAVSNIHKIVDKLGFDLYTHVIDWQEFRDLQRSFIKASVIDIELLTDHAISAIMLEQAYKNKISHTISGFNVVTEAILPDEWIHTKRDWGNIKSIQKQFGEKKIKTFPHLTIKQRAKFEMLNKLGFLSILNYIPFNKEAAMKRLQDELDWVPYEGKHFESIFTRFYQAYILPNKFQVDKRRAHLSSLICSGQIKRDEAMAELEKSIYDEALLNQDKTFVLKKLGFTEEEFDAYIKADPIPHMNYGSDEGKYKYYYFLKHKLGMA